MVRMLPEEMPAVNENGHLSAPIKEWIVTSINRNLRFMAGTTGPERRHHAKPNR